MKKTVNELTQHAGIEWGLVLISLIILLVIMRKTIFSFLKNKTNSLGVWYITVFLSKKREWWNVVKTNYSKWKVDVLDPW